MKKLQQNFTTTEQSKRLLELGVPADSADMHYHQECVRMKYGKKEFEYFLRYGKPDINTYSTDIPCWSVGRLMEIFDICIVPRNYTNWMNTERIPVRYITYIIDCYERSVQHQQLDFSKLKE